MSFLNSLLAQLGGGGHSTSPASAISPTTSAKVAQQPLGSVSAPSVSTGTNGATNAGQKRRAEEELERIMAKIPKRNESAPRPSASTNSKATSSIPSHPPKQRTLSSSTTIPSTSLASKPGTQASAKKAQDPPTTDNPKPPPKKGSYAEILARANAAQATIAKVGIIKHKSVEGGLRKKDRLNQRREGKDIPKQSVKTKAQNSRNEKLPLSRKGGEREKLVKDRAGESTYKGTSRAKPEMPAYKGTARPNNLSPTKSASKRGENLDRNRSRSTSLNPKPSRYRYASEEDDEEEEDYESDVSSDMEAAPFEVEEEEYISLKTAKREDEEALKEEIRLKKQKDEKKKMLAALAAKRR